MELFLERGENAFSRYETAIKLLEPKGLEDRKLWEKFESGFKDDKTIDMSMRPAILKSKDQYPQLKDKYRQLLDPFWEIGHPDTNRSVKGLMYSFCPFENTTDCDNLQSLKDPISPQELENLAQQQREIGNELAKDRMIGNLT